MIADEIIVFDHLKQKIFIIVNMLADNNIERTYKSSIERLKNIYKEITSSKWKVNENTKSINENKEDEGLKINSNFSKEEYIKSVLKAKEYIVNGDIFQVVLSQRLSVETNEDPFNIYRALRTINPSPYMYYLKFDDYRLIGSSPEMLVRVEGDSLETCPIAGQEKGAGTFLKMNYYSRNYLRMKKELAEHMMLVDLGRNDLGRISEIGSIMVKDLMHIERYSHVMHIVTNILGKLRRDKTLYDALLSILPAGTLSGAPKIRAMEIIDELEPTKRGPYGGAIGYISFNGNLDTCITIRTIVYKDNRAFVQAGAGIVYDSDPNKEYEECFNKASALLAALLEAREIR